MTVPSKGIIQLLLRFITKLILVEKRLYLLALVLLSAYYQSFAQKPNEKYQYHIRPSTSEIRIDGIADESAWKETEVAKDFFMMQPMDTSFANARTEVRMTYDRQNLYILVTNYKSIPGSLVVESLKRDFSFNKNDNFLMFMDTFDDRTNGFTFGSNAAGAPWDGQQVDGGAVDLSWDNRWFTKVKNDDEKWVWEASIPFKSIRYKPGISRWGINFSRLDLSISEKSAWAPVPRQFASANLAYTGVLVWDQPPPNPGPNISVIPYTAARISKNHASGTPSISKVNFGGDLKVGITPSINLDLTVNPDFSQVDVDVQQTNLERFELFFPERRQFFMENADIFANFGYATFRPFFSRRIGLGVPIQFGARLSGKLDKNWRIGLLDTQTAAQDSLPSHNFAVFALQRRVFSRSNIRFMFINKQAINYSEEKNGYYNAYNRNLGAEFNLASANNLWTGKALVFKSFSPGSKPEEWSHAADISYNKANLFGQWQHEYVGSDYNAEVGYIPNATRGKYYKIGPSIGYLFFVKSSLLNSHGPKLTGSVFWDNHFKYSDSEIALNYNFTFNNRATASVWVSDSYVRLLQPFDPTNTGKEKLAAGTEHKWNTAGFEFVSTPQKVFTYTLAGRYGSYYAHGFRTNLRADLGYRFQPYASVAFSGNYNNIEQPSGSTHLWLIGPRIDVTFRNNLFLTTFVQYNNQAKNVNLNTRFQWRYKPASDLYLVYTDNYLPENFHVKNRALVLKFTYWWNI